MMCFFHIDYYYLAFLTLDLTCLGLEYPGIWQFILSSFREVGSAFLFCCVHLTITFRMEFLNQNGRTLRRTGIAQIR